MSQIVISHTFGLEHVPVTSSDWMNAAEKWLMYCSYQVFSAIFEVMKGGKGFVILRIDGAMSLQWLWSKQNLLSI